MKKHISIILVHYNTPNDTKDCLESLHAIHTTGFEYRIIVVDNGSKEPLSLSHKFLEKNSQVDVIRSEANLGFSGGNNLGIQYALDHYDSDYFLLLNTDTIVDPDFLVQLYHCMQKDDKIGIAGAKIYFHKGYEYWAEDYDRSDLNKVIWFAGGVVDWQNLFAFHPGVDEVDRGQFDQVGETDFISGCTLLIGREVIERVGLLDDRYFLYLEDTDYSMRVHAAKLKVVYCPTAKVWHKISRSSGGSGSALQFYYQTRNRFYFTFKHGNFRNKLTALHLLFRLLRQGNQLEKKACWDFIFNRLGKQPYI